MSAQIPNKANSAPKKSTEMTILPLYQKVNANNAVMPIIKRRPWLTKSSGKSRRNTFNGAMVGRCHSAGRAKPITQTKPVKIATAHGRQLGKGNSALNNSRAISNNK